MGDFNIHVDNEKDALGSAFIDILNSIEVRQVKSRQVTFIYIALLTIQIVSKHLTVSSWRIECQ